MARRTHLARQLGELVVPAMVFAERTVQDEGQVLLQPLGDVV